jgi:single-stranded-DNA-specific exonuclease
MPPKPEYLFDRPSGLSGLQLRQSIMRWAAIHAGCEGDPEIAEFQKHNPTLLNPIADLPGLDLAVETVLEAMRQMKKIVVYGDFDCDGIAAVVLMLDFLESVPGADASRIGWYIPNRFDEGYGVTEVGLRGCIAQKDPDLLIVVDCGSSSRTELKNLGDGVYGRPVGSIVIDHHGVSESSAPHPAIAHLNPHAHPVKSQAGRGLRDMCAAGLVFLFCDAMHATKDIRWDRDRALVLAGVATYADVVPLCRINRAIVKKSIYLCNHKTVKPVLGLRALHKRLHRRSHKHVRIDEYTFGFEWGPCLNASGRLDEATASVKLLRARTGREAIRKAYECVAMNNRRIGIEMRILAEAERQARAQVEDRIPVNVILVAAPAWEVGVVGIVAGRLKERYHRPVIVCGMDENDVWRGSGRSVEGFDMGEWFREAKEKGMIVTGGGHPMAGGLRFTENQRSHLHEWLNGCCTLSQMDFVPRCGIYAEACDFEQKDWWSLINGLAPFGQRNPWRPILLCDAKLEHFLLHDFGGEPQPDPKAQKAAEKEKGNIAEEPDSKAADEADAEAQGLKMSGPALITGSFTTETHASPPIRATWREVDRARREWHRGHRYILELDVRRKGGKDDYSYYFAVLNSWEMTPGLTLSKPAA